MMESQMPGEKDKYKMGSLVTDATAALTLGQRDNKRKRAFVTC